MSFKQKLDKGTLYLTLNLFKENEITNFKNKVTKDFFANHF